MLVLTRHCISILWSSLLKNPLVLQSCFYEHACNNIGVNIGCWPSVFQVTFASKRDREWDADGGTTISNTWLECVDVCSFMFTCWEWTYRDWIVDKMLTGYALFQFRYQTCTYDSGHFPAICNGIFYNYKQKKTSEANWDACEFFFWWWSITVLNIVM